MGYGRETLFPPLLFVVAMEVLTALVQKAMDMGVLSQFPGITAMQRVSIYADDVTLFIKPMNLDLEFIKIALQAFGEASGLRVNYSKSSAIVIRGNLEDRQRVAALLQCDITEFPCRYLGLELAIKNLTHAEWQPMLDKVWHFVPAW